LNRIILDGSLIASGGCFQNTRGIAISLCGAKISGKVALNNGFRARGTVALDESEIGELICSEGRFENPGGVALSANGTKIGGGVFLNDGFRSLGTVQLENTEVAGEIDCTDGTFEQSVKGLVSSAVKPSQLRKPPA
jgi:hypothetical protein